MIFALLSWLTAAQDFRPALDEGIRLYWNGEYERTVLVLTPACEAGPSAGDKLECYKYVAFSHVALGDEASAQERFVAMLSEDPGYRLDPTLVPPKILSRFEAARDELASAAYQAGKDSYQGEDFARAVERFDVALTLSPDNELAREYRQLASERMSMAQPAAADAAAAIPEAPEPAPEPELDLATHVFRLTSDIERPVLVRQVAPVLPPLARTARWSGSVVLSVIIDREGRVTEARVIRSVREPLDQAAVDAVRRWEYRPATRNGVPVSVYSIVEINFEL